MSWKDYEGKDQDKENGNKGNNGNAYGKNKEDNKGQQKKEENSSNGNGNDKSNKLADCTTTDSHPGNGNGNNKGSNKGKGNGPLNNPGKGNKFGLYKKLGENPELKEQMDVTETAYLYQGLSTNVHKGYSAKGSPYSEYYMGANNQTVSRKMFGNHGLSNPSHDPNLKTTGGMLYYQYDGLNTVSSVTDRHGDIIENYRYDVFGGIQTGITAPYNHNAYTSQRYDDKAGLIDMNARWYDPTVGRFLTQDTYRGDTMNPLTQNRYSYVLNNPVNMWDPTGHVQEWVRAKDDYSFSYEKGNTLFVEIWNYVDGSFTQTEGKVKTTEEQFLKYYAYTHTQWVKDNWLYDYSKYMIIDEIPKEILMGEKLFEETYERVWVDIITAEELSQRNADIISSYGEAPISFIRPFSSELTINGNPFSINLIYGDYVDAMGYNLVNNFIDEHTMPNPEYKDYIEQRNRCTEWIGASCVVDSEHVIDEIGKGDDNFTGTYRVDQHGDIIKEFYGNFNYVYAIPVERIGSVRELDSFFEGTPLELAEYAVNPKTLASKGVRSISGFVAGVFRKNDNDITPSPGVKDKAKNVVYTSTNADDVVQYVGITNNYARRAAEHLRDKGINIQPLMKDLSRSDARAVEQALIEIHRLQKNGGTLMNKINSISTKNSLYVKQLKRGHKLLRSIGY